MIEAIWKALAVFQMTQKLLMSSMSSIGGYFIAQHQGPHGCSGCRQRLAVTAGGCGSPTTQPQGRQLPVQPPAVRNMGSHWVKSTIIPSSCRQQRVPWTWCLDHRLDQLGISYGLVNKWFNQLQDWRYSNQTCRWGTLREGMRQGRSQPATVLVTFRLRLWDSVPGI